MTHMNSFSLQNLQLLRRASLVHSLPLFLSFFYLHVQSFCLKTKTFILSPLASGKQPRGGGELSLISCWLCTDPVFLCMARES